MIRTIAIPLSSVSKPVDQLLSHRRRQKLLAVLASALAFFIPISTSITGILFVFLILLGLSTPYSSRIFSLIIQSYWAKMALFLYLLFTIGISYTSAPLLEALPILGKYFRLLGMVVLIPVFVDPALRKYAIGGFLTAIVLTLFFSYLQFFGFSNLPLLHSYGQAAIFKDRIQTNFLMAFGFYLFAQKFISLKYEEYQREGKYKKIYFRCHQITLIFLCALLLFNILFLSDGRSGYFIFLLLSLLLAWQKFKWRGVLYILGSLLLIIPCVFIFSPNFHNRLILIHDNIISYKQGHTETSVGLRLSFWVNSLELIAKHPFVGTGTASFKNEYFNFKNKHVANPHNEYLNIGVQLGVPAVIILLALFFLQWLESNALSRQYKEIAQAVLLAISIGCLGNSWLMDSTEGYFYAFFMALCFADNPRYYLPFILRTPANDP